MSLLEFISVKDDVLAISALLNPSCAAGASDKRAQSEQRLSNGERLPLHTVRSASSVTEALQRSRRLMMTVTEAVYRWGICRIASPSNPNQQSSITHR